MEYAPFFVFVYFGFFVCFFCFCLFFFSFWFFCSLYMSLNTYKSAVRTNVVWCWCWCWYWYWYWCWCWWTILLGLLFLLSLSTDLVSVAILPYSVLFSCLFFVSFSFRSFLTDVFLLLSLCCWRSSFRVCKFYTA